MKFLISLFLICISLTGFSQGLKQNMADKYYATLAYEKCAPMYAELAKKSSAATDVVRRAADSYRFLNVTKEAEKWYTKLVSKADAKPDDYYNYAQVLLINKKYDAADAQMEKFFKLNSGNSIAKRYNKAKKGYVKDLGKDSTKFEIKNLGNINSDQSDFAPAYFSNKTDMAFASNRESQNTGNKEFAWDNTNFLDLYKVKLDTAKQTAQKSERLNKSVETSYHDGPVSFSPDGKMMLLTRNSYFKDKLERSSNKMVNVQLYYALKEGENWGELKPFPHNNKEFSYGQACFAPDNQTIYFVSDMPGTYGYTDIWETTYQNNTFSLPKNLGQEINTEGREMFPFVDNDNLLLFASDGHVGLGGLDVHIAALGGSITYVGNIGYPLNTSNDDFGLIYDNDNMKGYFTSNREGGKGKDDLYAVKFKEPIVPPTPVQGLVVDNNTKRILANSKVYLFNKQNKVMDSTLTNNKGGYSFTPKNKNEITKIGADKQYYYAGDLPITDRNALNKSVDIYLNPVYRFICTVYDAKTKQTMNDVTVTCTQTMREGDKVYTTDATGTVKDGLPNKKKGDYIKLTVKLEKRGYITTLQSLEMSLDTTTVIVLSEYLNTNMQEMDKGIDIAKTINIKPIYFDYAKYNIRADAALELDKIVNVMKANPTIIIELGSHTDCRSSSEHNMTLSQNRAKSSAAYIISKGIDKKRIYGKGYGETKLLNKCDCADEQNSPCTEEQHQLNRRTEFVIVKY